MMHFDLEDILLPQSNICEGILLWDASFYTLHQEMMKAEVAQPYIEDGSIKETAQLLLDAQAWSMEQRSGGLCWPLRSCIFAYRRKDSLMPLALTRRCPCNHL